ncbi:hypothetical protein [Clostridium neonatale]|uniref:hypothetical protein n=1 Tax=Clostridium neonatale TaxID=137838 RepID=UPI00291B916E|nr:conserved hypothetical protein [Clostridium neonatale]
MKFKKYNGCGNCELAGKKFDCEAHNVPVNITFKHNEKADNWGTMVTIFRKGETVKGYAVVKDGIGYCASAASNIYNGYEDFIDTDNADIEII